MGRLHARSLDGETPGWTRKDVAGRLIKLGVPDDSGFLGHVVSQLAEMSISLGQAYLPDVSEMAALQIAIHDRLDELNGTNAKPSQIPGRARRNGRV